MLNLTVNISLIIKGNKLIFIILQCKQNNFFAKKMLLTPKDNKLCQKREKKHE